MWPHCPFLDCLLCFPFFFPLGFSTVKNARKSLNGTLALPNRHPLLLSPQANFFVAASLLFVQPRLQGLACPHSSFFSSFFASLPQLILPFPTPLHHTHVHRDEQWAAPPRRHLRQTTRPGEAPAKRNQTQELQKKEESPPGWRGSFRPASWTWRRM